jgi:hypothetical protein
MRALLLTLVVAFGMSLWLAQDGAVAAEMAVSTEAGGCAAGSCDGCRGGADSAAGAGACVAACAAAAQVVPPEEVLTSASASRAGLQPCRSSPDGRCDSPDHGPPKVLTFG